MAESRRSFGLWSPWTDSPMPPKVATLLAVAGVLCVLLTTFFGVSEFSNWLLVAAQAFLALGVVAFAGYIIAGIISDTRAL
jgi:hypothetical protein